MGPEMFFEGFSFRNTTSEQTAKKGRDSADQESPTIPQRPQMGASGERMAREAGAGLAVCPTWRAEFGQRSCHGKTHPRMVLI